jgi:hypothetical protein
MGLTRTSDIGENTRSMIQKMNSVGIGKIISFVHKNHPRENVTENIQRIRMAAKIGYEGTAYKLKITRQAVEQTVKKYYAYALQIEGGSEDAK